MKIIVYMKQIENNTTARPDRSGVEAALRLKKLTGASVTVLCLGKPSVVSQLREAMAMGCDDGILVDISRFEYLDAAACAGLLSAAIKEHDFDIIFTSCYAVDADAIPTGLLLAQRLKLPAVSYADEVRPDNEVRTDNEIRPTGDFLLVRNRLEDRSLLLRVKLPCLISALPLPGKPIYMTADGITRAYQSPIPTIAAEDLAAGPCSASPEELNKVRLYERREQNVRERGTVLTVSTDEAVAAIMRNLSEYHIL